MLKIKRKSKQSGYNTARSRDNLGESIKIPRSKNFSIIPSLSIGQLYEEQAKNIVDGLQKRHKVQKQNRKKKLEETYSENCRLFLSIKSQKSHYALPIRKSSKNYSRLPLLQKIVTNSIMNTTRLKLISTPCDRYRHNNTECTYKTQVMHNFEQKSMQEKQLGKFKRRKSLESNKK